MNISINSSLIAGEKYAALDAWQYAQFCQDEIERSILAVRVEQIMNAYTLIVFIVLLYGLRFILNRTGREEWGKGVSMALICIEIYVLLKLVLVYWFGIVII